MKKRKIQEIIRYCTLTNTHLKYDSEDSDAAYDKLKSIARDIKEIQQNVSDLYFAGIDVSEFLEPVHEAGMYLVREFDDVCLGFNCTKYVLESKELEDFFTDHIKDQPGVSMDKLDDMNLKCIAFVQLPLRKTDEIEINVVVDYEVLSQHYGGCYLMETGIIIQKFVDEFILFKNRVDQFCSSLYLKSLGL